MTAEDYLQEFFEWIVAYIQQDEGLNVTDINLVMIPEGVQNSFVDGAGGGAYVPSTYKPLLITVMNRVVEGATIEAGKTILVRVRSNICTDHTARMRAALILWHEFGHALGNPTREGWGEKPEERAWLFEVHAVSRAFQRGMLAKWGISAAIAKRVMEVRRSTYDKDYKDRGIRDTVVSQHRALMRALG